MPSSCAIFFRRLSSATRKAVADAYFQNPGAQPGLLPAWGGVLAFALQIFFDFSGYTDIAIGCAALFGFHFPENLLSRLRKNVIGFPLFKLGSSSLMGSIF